MYIIDRFEADWAVLEGPGQATFNLPRSLLPKNARPGDVLTIDIRIDEAATKERREKSRRLLDDFFDE
ncbi:MAG: DUF3006 domain-containing protein [Firmicutes bacterium]|nr:DUF3006 domain-containing protein [Bacillota bacterium]